jgi:RNA polymerase sigma factor (sigma-70 family)
MHATAEALPEPLPDPASDTAASEQTQDLAPGPPAALPSDLCPIPAAPREPPSDSPATVEELVRELRPKIRRLFANYRVPHSDAEDILQDALLATFLNWGEIRCKQGWLLVTLRHKCSVYWREKRYGRIQAVDPPALDALAPSLPAPQERAEMHWDLDRAAADLDRRHRQLLRLRYALGCSTIEIAERLGYEIASIRKLSCRSVDRLQQAIDGKRKLKKRSRAKL